MQLFLTEKIKINKLRLSFLWIEKREQVNKAKQSKSLLKK